MNVDLANEQLALLLKRRAVGAEMDAARMQPRLALLQEMMDDVGVGVDRIRNIVKDLQSLSRTYAAKTSVFALNDLLDETLAMVRNSLEHRATVVRKYDVLPPFTGDRSALGQVFLNLLLNAAQAVPAGHAQANAITVTTSQADGECRVAALGRPRLHGLFQGQGARLVRPAEAAARLVQDPGLGRGNLLVHREACRREGVLRGSREHRQ